MTSSTLGDRSASREAGIPIWAQLHDFASHKIRNSEPPKRGSEPLRMAEVLPSFASVMAGPEADSDDESNTVYVPQGKPEKPLYSSKHAADAPQSPTPYSMAAEMEAALLVHEQLLMEQYMQEAMVREELAHDGVLLTPRAYALATGVHLDPYAELSPKSPVSTNNSEHDCPSVIRRGADGAFDISTAPEVPEEHDETAEQRTRHDETDTRVLENRIASSRQARAVDEVPADDTSIEECPEMLEDAATVALTDDEAPTVDDEDVPTGAEQQQQQQEVEIRWGAGLADDIEAPIIDDAVLRVETEQANEGEIVEETVEDVEAPDDAFDEEECADDARSDYSFTFDASPGLDERSKKRSQDQEPSAARKAQPEPSAAAPEVEHQVEPLVLETELEIDASKGVANVTTNEASAPQATAQEAVKKRAVALEAGECPVRAATRQRSESAADANESGFLLPFLVASGVHAPRAVRVAARLRHARVNDVQRLVDMKPSAYRKAGLRVAETKQIVEHAKVALGAAKPDKAGVRLPKIAKKKRSSSPKKAATRRAAAAPDKTAAIYAARRKMNHEQQQHDVIKPRKDPTAWATERRARLLSAKRRRQLRQTE